MRLVLDIDVDNAAFAGSDGSGDIDTEAVAQHVERWIRGGFFTDAAYSVGQPVKLMDWNGNTVGSVTYTRIEA